MSKIKAAESFFPQNGFYKVFASAIDLLTRASAGT